MSRLSGHRFLLDHVLSLAVLRVGLEEEVDEIAMYGCDHSGCGGWRSRISSLTYEHDIVPASSIEIEDRE